MPDVQDIVAEVLRDDEYVLGTFGDTGPQGEKGDQGDTGPQGPAGPSNVLSIGTVIRGDDAEASITGTSPNQILNLTLPKGDQGIQGPEGPTGFAPIANVTKSGDTVTISITDKNGTTTESFTSYQEPLLSCKWSDHLLNDISWLRADTFSWQSGETYLSAYQHLLNDIGYVRYMIPNDDIQEKFYRSPSDDTTMFAWTNQYSTLYTESEFPENGDNFYYHNQVFGTVLSTGAEAGSSAVTPTTETIAGTTITYYLATDGHKIVLADQETTVQNIYNATGVAWYYILDTANQRFKLPRTKYGFTGLRDTVGKYVSESLPKPSMVVRYDNQGSTQPYDSTYGADGYSVMSSSDANERMLLEKDVSNSMKGTDILTDSTYQDNAPVQQRATQMYLYFYVGNFSQSATEQTAGLNTELFNGKVDLNGSNATFAHIVETYSSGTDWYRVWSDGWCEQGGIYDKGSASTQFNTTISLFKQFANSNYFVSAIASGISGDKYGEHGLNIENKLNISFDIYYHTSSSQDGARYVMWKAEGYIS